jgi:hypothetical protein
MTTETFNHADRCGFIERLGALSGKTTYREPGGGGHQPFVATSISSDNAMVLALSFARRNPRDIGPEVAYSVGTGQPHQRQRVVDWLADKLRRGTGKYGRNAERQLTLISAQAYELVIGQRSVMRLPAYPVAEFEVLVNIGAGWLWMAMEAAVERAERALHERESPVKEPCT